MFMPSQLNSVFSFLFLFNFWLFTSPTWHGFQEHDLAVYYYYYPSRCTTDVLYFPALGTKLGTYPSDMCKFLPYMAIVPRIWHRFFLGERNPHLSVSVSSPPDVATFKILAEGNEVACPWSIFQINFGDINTFRQSFEWETRRRNTGAEPRERSQDENRKGREGGSKRTMAHLSNRETRRRTCYQMWKRNLVNLCCSCPQ